MIGEWPLVGRAAELQIITQATRTAGDRATGVVLSGAAGMGKTRLATEAVAACGPRDARRRWIVGTASARSIPLGAFADIATDFGPDPLRRVREVTDALIGGDRDRAVVVVVDDAHLLDELSAFAVHQVVARRLATVILTIRSGEPQPDAITAIWKDRHLERLELQPLSLSETTHLVEQVLDGPVHSLCARRLWQYTQGNVLYLRHLLESEVAAGRIAKHSGMWLWDGRPALSPTLAELIESRIATAPASVGGVLDALAVAEPLDTDTLANVAGPDALGLAESQGLVRVDSRERPASVRLAHPMFGEVRRTGSRPLRRVRGRIAVDLARKATTDPRNLVRRAVLTVESDLAPDPGLLIAAASAAMQLLDVRLAETLAGHAVAAGGGPEAKIAHATAITWQERGVEAENILAELAGQVSGPARAQIAILRAINFAVMLVQPGSAERALTEALPDDDDATQAIADACRAIIDVVRGHASAAVDRAGTVVANAPASDVAHMAAIGTLISGLGDLGRIDEIEPAANRAYDLAERSAEVSHLRFPIAFRQANAYRLAGCLTASDATILRIRRDTLDVPYEQSFHCFIAGMSAMSRGALAAASRSLQESVAYFGTRDSGQMTKGLGRFWLATIFGMAGRAADARGEFAAIERSGRDPDAHLWDSEELLAEAWVCAAEGAISQAISITRDAAATESRLGRPAREVGLLQAATQFGDRTTAGRLAELAERVQGPRAPAAAAHAAALAAGSGDALAEASRLYEAFGDRIAAADAAAQAVVAYRNAGRQGAAMIASATARRLADECEGAQTPALRAATVPVAITARQREIISLAAQGLSNQEIAERLSMSVRSVQGHLFRASQRVGVNGRDELIAILQAPM
jgi:DNA-binding CsgD family transcriptional regulator